MDKRRKGVIWGCMTEKEKQAVREALSTGGVVVWEDGNWHYQKYLPDNDDFVDTKAYWVAT